MFIELSGEKFYNLVYFFRKWGCRFNELLFVEATAHYFYPGKKAAHDSIRVQPFYG